MHNSTVQFKFSKKYLSIKVAKHWIDDSGQDFSIEHENDLVTVFFLSLRKF